MINHISASVTFSTPTKSIPLSVDFSPQPGITAVIGRNGSGKSWSVMEVPRFLLFGKKSLRGLAADYKTMDAKGTFTIKGNRYEITRHAKREQIIDSAGTVLAVGAEAVTAKVVELLGYGLEVFDLCNASVQKKTDMLGQMKPTARKALVDNLVGFADYETIEKACREEAKNFKRDAEALVKVMRPVGDAPVKPDEYRPVEEIEAELAAGRRKLAQWAKLNAQVYRGMPPTQPMMPRTDEVDLVRVQREENNREFTLRERHRLDSIMLECRRYVADCLPEDQLVLAEARNAVREEEARRGIKPTMEVGEILAMQDIWDEIAFTSKINREDVTCPNCNHKFLTGRPVPEQPPVGRAELGRQLNEHKAWEKPLPEMPEGPDLTAQEIKLMRESNAADARFNEAYHASVALLQVQDQSNLLAAMRAAIPAWATYDERMAEHTRRVAASEAAEKDLEALGSRPTDEDGEALQQALRRSSRYDQDLVRYERDMEEFEINTAEVRRLTDLATKYKAGGDALNDARATLKAHLAPMLSRVASSLIYDMTAGDLSSVVVDEDMNITVDGQAIETLSGAGETVANLALRIGLGQVLVANTFPVFLDDEIDSDADEVRRAATKIAIQSLGSKLDQIILVSHRQIDIADHILDLDNTQ